MSHSACDIEHVLPRINMPYVANPFSQKWIKPSSGVMPTDKTRNMFPAKGAISMAIRTLQYFATILVGILLTTVAHGQSKHVMVINSYHAEFPWVAAHNSALQKGLGDQTSLSFYYLDTKRTPLAEGRAKAKELMSKISAINPDVVVLADDFALQELGTPIMKEGIPVVFLGINGNPRHYLNAMPLATGILERPLLKRSIAYIKDILNDLDSCLVLFDNKTTAQVVFESVFNGQKTCRFSKTDTTIKLHNTFAQWKRSVLESKNMGYDAIILGLYQALVDDEGNHVPAEEVAEWTSANSPVPVFGFWDFSIGKGKAMGGLILSGTPQGKEAAHLITKILDGHPVQTLQPVTAEHGRFLFSRSELRRWGITLPSYFNNPKEPIQFIE